MYTRLLDKKIFTLMCITRINKNIVVTLTNQKEKFSFLNNINRNSK